MMELSPREASPLALASMPTTPLSIPTAASGVEVPESVAVGSGRGRATQAPSRHSWLLGHEIPAQRSSTHARISLLHTCPIGHTTPSQKFMMQRGSSPRQSRSASGHGSISQPGDSQMPVVRLHVRPPVQPVHEQLATQRPESQC